MNYLVGLTGGIGSGKSTVADMFTALGVRVIDTDLISRQLTQAGGAAVPAIREAFGPDFVDVHGAMDRHRMRELVFRSTFEKKRLEAILHPLIFEQTQREATSRTKAPYTLIVVPLLFESGRYAGWLHRIVIVDCPEDVQIARTMQRSNLDKAAVRAIMAHQLDRSERLRLANDVIRNEGSLGDLQNQVEALHRRLCAMAAESD